MGGTGGERLAQARASVSDNAATENEPTEPDAFRRPSERSRAGQRSEVIRASYEVDAPEQAPDRSRDTQPPAPPLRPRSARFTFAPDYTWIQGRLEHSRASGEWKLRYIPIDGVTDEYGGSVVLENPRALGDLSSGDFVRIRGELTQAEQDGMTFAPIYRIVQVQAVAD